MPAISGQDQTPYKQLPVARWQVVQVNFETAHKDTTIKHSLNPRQPETVHWQVVEQNAPGVIYRGDKDSQNDYIVLRASVVGTYRIQLFIEANESLHLHPSRPNAVGTEMWPIGSVFVGVTPCEDPATLLGFGTWEQIGQGKVLVGEGGSGGHLGP